MFEWLSRITITCFAASYLLVLVLEASRLFFRFPVRFALMIGLAAAGLFAHTAYLWSLARAEISKGALFSNWYDWLILASWVMAGAYLGLAIRRPRNTVGVFVLPLVLGLVALALPFREKRPTGYGPSCTASASCWERSPCCSVSPPG